MSRGIFSGEPLPLQPSLDDLKGLEDPPNLGRFHFKLIEYLRRLGAKLDAAFNRDTEGKVEAFAAYIDTEREIAPGYENIPFGIDKSGGLSLVTWNDKPYTLQGDGSVKILLDGLYLFSIDVEFDIVVVPPPNPGIPVLAMRIMLRRGGVGWIPIHGYASVKDTETVNMSIALPIKAGFIMHFQARSSVLPSLFFENRGTRLQILRLATTLVGDKGPPTWLNGDPPVWIGKIVKF